MRGGASLLVLGCSLVLAQPAKAVSVPEHDPLRIHVISDEVNPHGLSAAELTQPGDLSAALNRAEVGLNLAAPVQETASDCVDAALTALADQSVDVIVYFAHRGARDCQGADAQTELTAAFSELLTRGGGIVAFHHGLYEDPQKTAVLQLIGASASGIAWNTTEGQRVFATAPEHFVASHGVSYDGEAALTGGGTVPTGTFSYFDNLPDERYPSLSFLEEAGETRTLLFATDSGGVRPLGYALERPSWQGRVVGYQPGEYQPNALDDLAGPNLQVLVNAVLWASGFDPDAGGSGAGGSGAGGSGAGGAGSDGDGAVSSSSVGTTGGAGGAVSSSSSSTTGGSAASGGMPGVSSGGELTTTSSGGASSSTAQPAGGAVGGDATSGSTSGAPVASGGAGSGVQGSTGGAQPATGASRSGGCSLTPHSAASEPRALLTLMLGLLLTGSLLRRARRPSSSR